MARLRDLSGHHEQGQRYKNLKAAETARCPYCHVAGPEHAEFTEAARLAQEKGWYYGPIDRDPIIKTVMCPDCLRIAQEKNNG